MSLVQRITEDLKSAQRAGAVTKVELLRFLLAQIHNREIEKRGGGEDPTLTDEETAEVLRRESKKRKEAVELFRRGGRTDLVEKEEEGIAFIAAYLPAELKREDIARVIDELKAGGLTDFNSLMKEAIKKLKGQADGKTVSEVIKERLG